MRRTQTNQKDARRVGRLAALALFSLATGLCLLRPVRGQMTAPPAPLDHPTHAPPGARYVGSEACATCHRAQSASHRDAGMGHAARKVEECRVLESKPSLTFKDGPYAWRIERQGRQSRYTVTDGKETISVPLAWCFGKGEAGQTYIFERGGDLYESRVSYYLDTDALDYTLGAPRAVPESLEAAAGRRMASDDARDCFSCHTTASVSEAKLQLARAVPGVTCEGCHGPGAEHIEAIKAGKLSDLRIRPGARGTAEDVSNFCGNCHRTWSAVMLQGIRGVANVRFQPYRLTNSPCYDSADRRISCLACHDPHANRRREPASYDESCLACHSPQAGVPATAASAAAAGSSSSKPDARAKACPKGTRLCVECHMPKYELPGSHFRFTDHWIRVVRAGAPYPD